MAFTQQTDYKGYYQISGNSFSATELDLYINREEPERLRDLLGCTLYDLFVADLVGNVPQSARFLAIFNPICDDDGNTYGLQYRSEGMVEMLKGFVYYSYVKQSDFANVISGNIKNAYSNSQQARGVEFNLDGRYNRAIISYQAIQWFICDNISTYPEYNGISKEVVTWL